MIKRFLDIGDQNSLLFVILSNSLHHTLSELSVHFLLNLWLFWSLKLVLCGISHHVPNDFTLQFVAILQVRHLTDSTLDSIVVEVLFKLFDKWSDLRIQRGINFLFLFFSCFA